MRKKLFLYILILGLSLTIKPEKMYAQNLLPFAKHNFQNYSIVDLESVCSSNSTGSLPLNTNGGVVGLLEIFTDNINEKKHSKDWGKYFTNDFTVENVKWMFDNHLIEDLGEAHFKAGEVIVSGLDPVTRQRKPLAHQRGNYPKEHVFGFYPDKLLLMLNKVSQGETSFGKEVMGSLICLNDFRQITQKSTPSGEIWSPEVGASDATASTWTPNTSTNSNSVPQGYGNVTQNQAVNVYVPESYGSQREQSALGWNGAITGADQNANYCDCYPHPVQCAPINRLPGYPTVYTQAQQDNTGLYILGAAILAGVIYDIYLDSRGNQHRVPNHNVTNNNYNYYYNQVNSNNTTITNTTIHNIVNNHNHNNNGHGGNNGGPVDPEIPTVQVPPHIIADPAIERISGRSIELPVGRRQSNQAIGGLSYNGAASQSFGNKGGFRSR